VGGYTRMGGQQREGHSSGMYCSVVQSTHLCCGTRGLPRHVPPRQGTRTRLCRPTRPPFTDPMAPPVTRCCRYYVPDPSHGEAAGVVKDSEDKEIAGKLELLKGRGWSCGVDGASQRVGKVAAGLLWAAGSGPPG